MSVCLGFLFSGGVSLKIQLTHINPSPHKWTVRKSCFCSKKSQIGSRKEANRRKRAEKRGEIKKKLSTQREQWVWLCKEFLPAGFKPNLENAQLPETLIMKWFWHCFVKKIRFNNQIFNCMEQILLWQLDFIKKLCADYTNLFMCSAHCSPQYMMTTHCDRLIFPSPFPSHPHDPSAKSTEAVPECYSQMTFMAWQDTFNTFPTVCVCAYGCVFTLMRACMCVQTQDVFPSG